MSTDPGIRRCGWPLLIPAPGNIRNRNTLPGGYTGRSLYWDQPLVVANNTPTRGGRGTYAKHYGRCLHFLTRAGRELGDARLLKKVQDLAAEAVTPLYENSMFQGYPTSHLY